MANLLSPATNNKCLITHCPVRKCPNCWQWYNPNPDKPKHKCVERDKPNRQLLKTCPGCRSCMATHDNKTESEKDARENFVLKVVDRIVYSREHPKRHGVRSETRVRTTRGTNAARTVRAVR